MTGPAHPPLENDHGPTCDLGTVCVSCGGCGCGFVPRTCADGRCYSVAQAEADEHHAEMMADPDPDYGRDIDGMFGEDDADESDEYQGDADGEDDGEFDEFPYGEH